MTEEDKIKKAYREYQLGTQGIDIWEEGAFRAGWLASKNFFKPDVIKSVCCDAELIKLTTYGYDECIECGKTYRQQTVL